MNLLGFLNRSQTPEQAELPDIYPLSVQSVDFINSDIVAVYTKILIDTMERTHGIPDDLQPLLWDNCVQSENSDGLITLLVDAMVKKSDLFLVYKPSLGVIRRATSEEAQKIRTDYGKSGTSELGVFVSFRNYRRTDMLKIYSALEYCILASLHKSVNISKAVQIKMSKLRDSVSLQDSGIAVAQAKSLAQALSIGRDVFLDKDDEITNATPDIGPTEKAIEFLDAKRAYILNLPLAYISGLPGAGLGATGEADMRAIERGLKQFYFSIVKPVVETLFDVDTDFKTQDFRQVSSALEALKTFELVEGTTLLSEAAMRSILARLFDLDEEEEATALEDEAAAAAADRRANPPPPPPPAVLAPPSPVPA